MKIRSMRKGKITKNRLSPKKLTSTYKVRCEMCQKDVSYVCQCIISHSWTHIDILPFSCSKCCLGFHWGAQTILRKSHIPNKCPDAHVVDHRMENRKRYQEIRVLCFPKVTQRYVREDFDIKDNGTEALANQPASKDTILCCEICKKAIVRDSVTSHAWSHMEIRRFSCSNCDRSVNFSQLTKLKNRHIPNECPDAQVVDNRLENYAKYMQIRCQCFPTVPQRILMAENPTNPK